MKVFGPRAPGVKDIQAAFSTIPRVFRLAWEAHRLATIGMAVVTILLAILPTLQLWVAKQIIDAVVNTIILRTPIAQGIAQVLPFLLLEFVLLTLNAFAGESRTLVQRMLSTRLRMSMNTSIIKQAIALDMQYFENPLFYDKLQNARHETEFRSMTLVDITFTLIQQVIMLALVVGFILVFNPLIALLLFGAMIPSLLAQMKYSDKNFLIQTLRAPETRRLHYLEQLLTVDTSAKEIKLFGLGLPLLKRYQDLFWKFYREDTNLARQRALASVGWGMIATASYYVAYAWIVWEALNGRVTIGDLTFYIGIVRQSQLTVQTLFNSLGQVYESALFMQNLFTFLALPTQMTHSGVTRRVARPIWHGIEFRNVSFRYPGRTNWVLKNINLHIRPGEKLALVGANGAGKTTLVKLLTRLYDPTEGQILLDGVDLREYDLDDLRQAIGVIFQDFVRYQATASENIGFGDIQSMHERERITLAAKQSGADEVIKTLPQTYDTMLGTWFENGRELSGGQWQKIALARAFMRNSQVLVLDEPTAALDAEHEYEIFLRFRDLTEGRMALLISHRFSTVRMADRIIVIEDGQLAELGTHHELLERDGIYARLFNLQAQGYR